MGVSLEEVIEHGGYDIRNDIDDARWLLDKKEEFEELCEAADNLADEYDEYEWYVQELEDSDDYGHIVPFEEWRKTCEKKRTKFALSAE